MKQVVKSLFGDHYDCTEKDPVLSTSSCTTHRDRPGCRSCISQRLLLDNLKLQYPLPEGDQYPTVPFPFSSHLSFQDRAGQSTFLQASALLCYRSTLGGVPWLQRISKPEATFAHKRLSRVSTPTLCDYSLGAQVLQYCTGTADILVGLAVLMVL